MREILFRGKRIDNGEWVYGYLVHRSKHWREPDDRYFIIFDGEFQYDVYDGEEVDPDTVGQYTGLTDRKGHRIFEGDIVNHVGAHFPIRCLVKYGAGEFSHGYHKYMGWVMEDIEDEEWDKFNCNDVDGFEIIGNMFDNPELLNP